MNIEIKGEGGFIKMTEQAESQEARVEKIEIQKEDTESELSYIEQTIQQVDLMTQELPKSQAKQELHIFKQKLLREKEAQEQILNEQTESIEHIRGY